MKVQEIVRAARELAEPPEELWSKIKARLEVWKVIEGFEAYEVSNMGRVRRTKAPDRYGRLTHAGKLLKPAAYTNGYLGVSLYRFEGKASRLLHLLVARAFISNPLKLPQVNHKDGNKKHCQSSNLEWRSELGNHRHALKLGLKSGDGVYFHARTKKWRAIFFPAPQRNTHLGTFNTKREALAARKVAIDSLPDIL